MFGSSLGGLGFLSSTIATGVVPPKFLLFSVCGLLISISLLLLLTTDDVPNLVLPPGTLLSGRNWGLDGV